MVASGKSFVQFYVRLILLIFIIRIMEISQSNLFLHYNYFESPIYILGAFLKNMKNEFSFMADILLKFKLTSFKIYEK